MACSGHTGEGHNKSAAGMAGKECQLGTDFTGRHFTGISSYVEICIVLLTLGQVSVNRTSSRKSLNSTGIQIT